MLLRIAPGWLPRERSVLALVKNQRGRAGVGELHYPPQHDPVIATLNTLEKYFSV